MLKTFTKRPARAAALLMTLAAAGCTAGAGEISMADQPLSCEITKSTANGALVLRGVVHAEEAVSGTYRLTVTGSGGGNRSNISQGGRFSAGQGETANLGMVMLGNRGASYDARLEIEADGLGYQCAERI